MSELIARTPCKGLLPLEIGGTTLSEIDAGVMTSVAPFRGREKEVSDLLTSAHALTFPKINRSAGKDGNRIIWFARGQALLMGPPPDAGLDRYAALTDQSDAWAVVRLDGRDAVDVLARLVPVDLRQSQFKRGHTIRTLVVHMMASITRVGDSAFQIMVFRSMATTLVHELKTAMEGVAARG